MLEFNSTQGEPHVLTLLPLLQTHSRICTGKWILPAVLSLNSSFKTSSPESDVHWMYTGCASSNNLSFPTTSTTTEKNTPPYGRAIKILICFTFISWKILYFIQCTQYSNWNYVCGNKQALCTRINSCNQSIKDRVTPPTSRGKMFLRK